jgi:hypothetical protein
MIAELLSRHASRLEKWEMRDSCNFVKRLASLFSCEVNSYEACVVGTEEALIGINRLQSWVDAVIPWSVLDKNLHKALVSEPKQG